MTSPSQSRLAETRLERQRSIKFTDPFNPVARAPAPILVRRDRTAGPATLDPRSPVRPTVGVQDHQIVGRAPPVAQFKMVTSPRSPIAAMNTSIQRKGTRAPLRSHSTILVQPGQPKASSSDAVASPQPGASMIPIRRNMSTLPQPYQAHPLMPHKRGALPQSWIPASHHTTSGHVRSDTVPSRPLKCLVDTEHRRTASDSAIIAKPGFTDYPQLSSGERNVLVSKLRMLLKSINIDGEELVEWERVAIVEGIEIKSLTHRVFGTTVKESVSYASCKVILGEHTHYLPACIFASVEEICRSGITTPALFRLAPSQSKRTLEHLTKIYDTGPSYGQTHSLANEDISNICALLKLYLRGLPEPIFSPTLWPALCQVAFSQSEPKVQITAIQAMFRLLDRSSFSTLVYLLAFLHQLALHGSQNGLTILILAEMFGPALFSPRTQAAAVGLVLSPKPEVPTLVKTFRSSEDKSNGARVLGWILERWEQTQDGGLAAGLLSLDIAKDGEDVAEWAARFAVEERRGSFGSGSETIFSEAPSGDRKSDMGEVEKLKAFPFPEVVSVEQVRVRQVKHSIVEITEVPPQSTRSSSPTTIWSQDTASQKSPTSRTGYSSAHPEVEPAYVAELRHRMEAQEAELVTLRRELATIRDRFVFPLPPIGIPGQISAGTRDKVLTSEAPVKVNSEEAPIEEDMNEDMMPTPRPPSGSHFGGPTTPTSTSTMRELVDSLQSEPTTPLFGRILRIEPAISRKSSDEILGANVFSDLGCTTPPSDSDNEDPQLLDRSFFVVNPDSTGSTAGRRKLSELYAARDALKGALDAMGPVQVQLRAVEQELQSRAG